jgi:hypothetical protein
VIGMIYIPGFMTSFRNSWGKIHRKHGDFICLLPFFQNKGNRLKRGCRWWSNKPAATGLLHRNKLSDSELSRASERRAQVQLYSPSSTLSPS